ncbi:MAG: YfhL family 4Fe-4S dicluster ferredoxin [Thiovulaceae bacterium]|nr:YfhL family 4Fe-4S dicluster ferredoxin [Sulfurimonadaceae bacterium]
MALLINEECIACDACREECPTEAIEEGDPIYIVDPDRCTECAGVYDEPICIAVCPVDCFQLDKDNVETIPELQFKYAQILKEYEE